MAAEVAICHQQRSGKSSKRNQPRGVEQTSLGRACPHADLIVENRFRECEDFVLGLVGLGRLRTIRGNRTIRAPSLLLRRMRRTPIKVCRDNWAGGLPQSERRSCQKKTRCPEPPCSHSSIHAPPSSSAQPRLRWW